jgi:hypothetical protein
VSVMIRGRSLITSWCVPGVLCVFLPIGVIGELKLPIVFDQGDRGVEVADHI